MTIQVRFMQAEADYRRDRLIAEFEAQQAKKAARQVRRRHAFRNRRQASPACSDQITIAVQH